MHDILEARCPACGFTVKGLDETRAQREPLCPMCGAPFAVRSNLSVSRRLPVGLGLLMGAFVASRDASPLMAREASTFPGFARRQSWP